MDNNIELYTFIINKYTIIKEVTEEILDNLSSTSKALELFDKRSNLILEIKDILLPSLSKSEIIDFSIELSNLRSIILEINELDTVLSTKMEKIYNSMEKELKTIPHQQKALKGYSHHI